MVSLWKIIAYCPILLFHITFGLLYMSLMIDMFSDGDIGFGAGMNQTITMWSYAANNGWQEVSVSDYGVLSMAFIVALISLFQIVTGCLMLCSVHRNAYNNGRIWIYLTIFTFTGHALADCFIQLRCDIQALVSMGTFVNMVVFLMATTYGMVFPKPQPPIFIKARKPKPAVDNINVNVDMKLDSINSVVVDVYKITA